ncbi:tumor susceptibility gene 101 protein-like isoform X1 [Paramormyrops kingsleyae]|uniref:tumor susceptibility gene 101 protein-like isoform X1 n=1 Tax=Paramormyrops kingsleyae TaxID=1676925 RepID=UPI000CD65ECE|nr:tumor susceptibility gene 101 protein-like isoform X1 [Paramormyrops kingsleyae]
METVRLKKMLSKKYKHRHLIACEIWSVICQYTSLKPVLDTYVFNDGSSRHLMCLTGTIPVCHKGMECNIPVSLWLLQSYPLHPPMCYIQPTKSSMIVRSENVDGDGKVDLPYLQTWKPPLTDLHGLVQAMRVTFGNELPLCKCDSTPAGLDTINSEAPLESPCCTVYTSCYLSDGFLSLPVSQTQTEAQWSARKGSKVILSREDVYSSNESKC